MPDFEIRTAWMDPIIAEQRAAQGWAFELIAKAAEADEIYSSDELEEHAARLAKRRASQHTAEQQR